jgi:succinate dehydrogenase / fumarate reductase, cytochrome b subunit
LTTATAPDYALHEIGGRYHFLLRRLHSLTGIVFGGYLVVHLLVNATLIEGSRHDGGPSVFQLQVDKIHSLPFLAVVETLFIYLPILFHTVYGIWITLTGQPNVGHYSYKKNWFYFFQRVSAIVLVFFMLFHVLGMKGVFGGELGYALTFAPLEATQSTVNHMKAAWWIGYVVYPIGILASCYHLANGFWTAGITWGLTISEHAQKRWGRACTGLFLLTLVCATMALVATLRDQYRPLRPSNVPDVRVPIVEGAQAK